MPLLERLVGAEWTVELRLLAALVPLVFAQRRLVLVGAATPVAVEKGHAATFWTKLYISGEWYDTYFSKG